MIALLASIPSPDSGAIHIGDIQLRMYGLMIALGVIAAVWLTGKRLEDKGIGKREDIQAIALWAVPAGVIGARLYHVITDWQRFEDDPWSMFKIWEGGLGIWGGIALGVLVGGLVARRRGLPMWAVIDAGAPALALAQAIGRWGNWWNQELFGKPTDLPWGLEIDPSHRPPGYEQYGTFHPAFLYESLWNFALCGVLLWVDKRYTLRPGRLFAMYVAGYTFARFWIERIRIDEANEILGLRVNEWVSALVFMGSAAFLVVDWLLHRRQPGVEAVAQLDH
ncbi:MAG TPA: prolipoprotein diacylglyceryl transferase [Acidimicrobiales bacterium]